MNLVANVKHIWLDTKMHTLKPFTEVSPTSGLKLVSKDRENYVTLNTFLIQSKPSQTGHAL